MKKKILAIALCAAMILGALAVSASARITFGASEAEAAPPPAPNPNHVEPYDVKEGVGYFPLWICGKQVTTENMKDIFGEEKPDAPKATAENGPDMTEDPNTKLNKGKVSFDPNTCTLTLDGASLLFEAPQTANFGMPATIMSMFDPKTYPDSGYEDVTLTIKVTDNSFVGFFGVYGETANAIFSCNDVAIEIAPGKSLTVEGGVCLQAAEDVSFDLSVRGGALYVVSCDDSIAARNLNAVNTTIYALNECQVNNVWISQTGGGEANAVLLDGDLFIENSILHAVNDFQNDTILPHTEVGFSTMQIYGNIKTSAGSNFTALASPYPYAYSEREHVTMPAVLHCDEYGDEFDKIAVFIPEMEPGNDYACAMTVCIESDSYCSSFRKVSAPENQSFMTIRLADGTVGDVHFIEVRENAWLINLVEDLTYRSPGEGGKKFASVGDEIVRVPPEEGGVPLTDLYVGVGNDATFAVSEEMYLWSWSPIFNCFYTTVSETEWVEVPVIVKEPDAKWYEVWKYHIEPRRYAVEVFKTYYLQTGKDGAKLTESPLFAASALYQDRRNPTHTPSGKAAGLGNGTHAVTCAACKKVTVERCKFNALTHRCTQCGGYDPKYIDFYTPLLTAEQNGKSASVVFTVNVKMVNPTVKPAKVEYAVGKAMWNEVKGNRFIVYGTAAQFGPANPLFIRVTDLNGMETIYEVDTVLADGSPLIPLDDDRHPQPPMPRP